MHTANEPAGIKPLKAFKVRVQRTFGMGRITQEQFKGVLVHIEAIQKILDINKSTKNKKSDEAI